MDNVEVIVIEELNRLFPRVISRMNSQRMSFRNDWTKGYTGPPSLSTDYYFEKQIKFGSTRPDYFKGRNSLSKGRRVVYQRGKNKGQPIYNYSNSLHFKLHELAKNSRVGELIYKNSGGLGVKTKVASGLDHSKGAIVNGKPKKYGARGGLVNARWQDIVSQEFIRLGKLKGARPINGYSKSKNPNYVVRPDGSSISLTRAIAEGNITINLQGSFFRNIKQQQNGFLNFLIKHTSLLRLRTAERGVSTYRIIGVLEDLARNDRLILDPVFGEVLEDIRKRLKKLVKEVSSRG